ncbi:hypothetical protein MVES1_001548 [Malassezia vespertilionis]|uniref:uncharacterized protein n=1 Tax=Malassezia vespertilionis TaxID=2020962 RepID=UPI0024B1FFE4|nr:uncharacterized protein MVES1_001548 [Malassezia vespertilionis]WFD06206.1 hypothetical protein MVES1_001548 [Malassezia vespertilionis]
MAGGHHHRSLKVDPSIEKWQEMRFRWTSKNTPLLIFWGFFVPGLAMYGFSKTNYQWDYTGKSWNESLLRKPPAPAAPKDDEE